MEFLELNWFFLLLFNFNYCDYFWFMLVMIKSKFTKDKENPFTFTGRCFFKLSYKGAFRMIYQVLCEALKKIKEISWLLVGRL